jgi:hypothetical protein
VLRLAYAAACVVIMLPVGTARAQYLLPTGWDATTITRETYREITKTLSRGATRPRHVNCSAGSCTTTFRVVTNGPASDRLADHLANGRTVVVGLMVAPVGNNVEARYRLRQDKSFQSEFLVAIEPRAASDPVTTPAGDAVIGRWALIASSGANGRIALRRFSDNGTTIAGLVVKCATDGGSDPADFLDCRRDRAAHALAHSAGTTRAAVIGCAGQESDYLADDCFRRIAEQAVQRRPAGPSTFATVLSALRAFRADWRQDGPDSPYWFQCDGGCCTAEGAFTIATPPG